MAEGGAGMAKGTLLSVRRQEATPELPVVQTRTAQVQILMEQMSTEATAPARAGAPRSLKELRGPRPWPVLGNLPQLDLPRMHKTLERWADEYGPLYRLTLGGKTVVVIADGPLIAGLLRDRPDGWRRIGVIGSVIKEMGGDGVFTAEGDDWRRQRRLVMSAFDPSHLARFFPSLVRVTERLDRRIGAAAQSGEAIDLQAQLMRYTVDVTAGLAFGADVNTIDAGHDVLQAHLDKLFPMIYRRINLPFPYWRHVRLPIDRDFDRHLAKVHKAVRGFVEEARLRMAAEPERAAKPPNLLEALLAARDADGSALGEAQIAGNVLTVLLGGEDTTANTLGWALYLLHRDRDAWQRLVDEVDATVDDERVLRDFDRTRGLDYVEECIHEAMRLRPVAPLIFVESNRDSTLAGMPMRKGTIVFCVMRYPAVVTAGLGSDAAEFRPARWLDGGSEGIRALNRSSMPFGGGPRLCPGRYLALLEMKMVLSLIARNYTLVDVGTESGEPPAERLAFAMFPVGLRMKLAPRPGR